VLVGLFNTAFGYGLYLLLLFGGLPVWAAWGLSLLVSLLIGFRLSQRVVFQGATRGSIVLYFVSWGCIYLLNVVLLGFIGEPVFGPLLILPLNVVLSYLVQKYVVFKDYR